MRLLSKSFFAGMNLLAAVALLGVGVWYITLGQRVSGWFLIAAGLTTMVLAAAQFRAKRR